MITEAQWAYLAGLIDGEGTFVVSTNKQPRCRIGMKHEATIRWIQETFGGTFWPESSGMFKWQAMGDLLRAVTYCCDPYLITKKEQAKIVAQILELKKRPRTDSGHASYTPQEQESLLQALREAKK